MYVVTCTIRYDAADKIRGWAPEKYAELRTALPILELDEDPAKLPEYWSPTFLADTRDMEAIERLGMLDMIEIKRVKGVHQNTLPSAAGGVAASGTTIVNVAVPGGAALLDIREVTWLEDACTQDLQVHLDRGWKILAVCPPNDTRRPTYVLGRADDTRSRR